MALLNHTFFYHILIKVLMALYEDIFAPFPQLVSEKCTCLYELALRPKRDYSQISEIFIKAIASNLCITKGPFSGYLQIQNSTNIEGRKVQEAWDYVPTNEHPAGWNLGASSL